MFWICVSMNWCVRVTWECRDASVAQSCMMDSRSCWEAGSENTDVLFCDGVLLVSVSRRCEICWVIEWMSVGILWSSPVVVESEDEFDGDWWGFEVLRVMRLGARGVGI